MFGSKPDSTAPLPDGAPYGGVTYESCVQTFSAIDNEATVSKRLGELGALGWEPVAVLDRPLGMTKRHGEGAFSVLLKRRILHA